MSEKINDSVGAAAPAKPLATPEADEVLSEQEEVVHLPAEPPRPPPKSLRKRASVNPPVRSAVPPPRVVRPSPNTSASPPPPPPGRKHRPAARSTADAVIGEPPTISLQVNEGAPERAAAKQPASASAPSVAEADTVVRLDSAPRPPERKKPTPLAANPPSPVGSPPRPPAPPKGTARQAPREEDPKDAGAPRHDAVLRDDAPAQQAPAIATAARPLPRGGGLGAPAPPKLPIVPMTAATDSILQLAGAGDVLPTKFDLDAGERHASPWTEEKQAESLVSNAERLRDLFLTQIGEKGDRQRVARLHYEAARLFESPLGDVESAAKHFEQASRLAPKHLPSVRGVRRTQLTLKRYQPAVRWFDVELEGTAEPEQRAMLLYSKACILEGHLGQRVEAREALEQASELAPRNLGILKATALSQEYAEAWEPLVRTFERIAATLGEQPAQRAVYLSHMARVCALRLGDVARAIELYKSAFDTDPTAPGALVNLKELLYRHGRFGELISVLESETSLASEPSSRAFAKFRVARLYAERLADPAQAVRALEHASSLVPEDQTILHELVRSYEVTGQHEELASALERLSALTLPPSLELLERLGELYSQQLEQPERAIERFQQALVQRPGYRPVLLALEELREKRGEWTELVQMLDAQAEQSSSLEMRAALHERMADICERQLRSPEYAIQHHRRAIELKPGHEPSYKALVRLLSEADRFHDLVEVYERGVEQATTNEERITTLFQIGRLEEDGLKQPSAALQTYRRILDIDGGHIEAIHALQRAAERAGEYAVLCDALELEADKSIERARQLSLRHRIANVLENELHDRDAALVKLDGLLEQDPAYGPAIASLQRIYYKENRHEDLLRAFGRELAITREITQRADLLCKMAELCHRRLAQPEAATTHYRKAVQADPKHLTAIRALRRVCTEQGDFKEVVRLLEAEVPLTVSDDAKVRTLFLLGEILENHLESNDKALDAYSEALTIDPGYRPALDGSLRLLEASRSFKQLKERLSAEISESEPLFANAAAYHQGEVIRDHLNQLPEAAEAFEDLLRRDPQHLGALSALERVHSQLGDRERLVELYGDQARILKGEESGVAAQRALLQLLETQGDSEPESLKVTLLAILRLSPSDVSALFSLEQLALQAGDSTLISQIDAKLGVANLDRPSISAYQTRLAEAMDARGDSGALEVFRAALSHDPENLAAARGISRIAESSRTPELLAEAAENEVRLLRQPAEAARLLVLAASKLKSGGKSTASCDALTRAVRIDPENAQAVAALIALSTETAAFDPLIDTLSQAATAAASVESRAQLWCHVARLHNERKDDVGAAVAAAKRAVQQQPTSIEAHVLLATLHSRSKDWQECATEFQEIIKLHPPEDVRYASLLQLAGIQHEHLDRTPVAIQNATAALEIQPDSREALRLLLTLQLAREDLERAADTARRLVAVSTTAPEKAEALFHSAKLERKRNDVAAALAAYSGAVSIMGMGGGAARELRLWLDSRGRNEEFGAYADALTTYLSQNGLSEEQRLPVHLELGRVLCDQVGTAGPGLRELQAALAMVPNDVVLRAEVADRVERAGQHEEGVRQYRELLAQSPQALQYWRSLSLAYAALGRAEQSRLCLAPLVAGGDATSEEFEQHGSVGARPAKMAPRAFEGATLQIVEDGLSVSGAAVDLLQALASTLPKLYPVSFEKYGLTKGDRLTSRTSNSLRQTADTVAGIFGVTEFEMYVHQGNAAGITVEMSEAPALMVSASVSSLSEPEQVFLFSRVMWHVARGTSIIQKLLPEELESLLACAARTYDLGFGSELGDAATLDTYAKRISKAMPWFSGGRLEPSARAYAAARLDAKQWVRSAGIAAARAAALVADDLAVSLAILNRERAGDAFSERVSSFVTSDSGVALKRKLSSGS